MNSDEPRWATFDCYGTLVDWLSGIQEELERLFGVEHADDLLALYHELEPEIQAGSPGMSYREVLTVGLERLADERGMAMPEGEASALARSLPRWPVFPDVPPALAEARRRGWIRRRDCRRQPRRGAPAKRTRPLRDPAAI